MESEWYHIAILIGIAIFGLWVSIPYGLAFGFDPWTICITNIIGSSIGVTMVYFLGNYIIRLWENRRSDKMLSRKKAKMLRIMNKYGLAGLGLLMPGLLGPSLGMAISITLVINRKWLWIFTLTGNVLWSILLITLVNLGYSAILLYSY